MELSNQVALITGAATGLGQGLALELARRGASVVVADLNDCSETVTAITRDGGKVLACQSDVTDAAAVRALICSALTAYGQLNIVCANTGSSFGGGTLSSVALDDMRKTYELNVFSVVSQIQAALPALQRAAAAGQPAQIMITASEHALAVPTTSPALISYTSSKHALLGLAACARRDLTGTGIGVTLLCPGWIRTPTLMSHAAHSEAFTAVMDNYGQDVAEVARLAVDGMLCGDFILPTNPASRAYSLAAHEEILAAVAALPV